MLPQGSYKQICRAWRAVTLCARTHCLTRARRVTVSPAHPQACKTFQVHSPSFKLPQGYYKQLCRARTAVTLCARTHRPTRARSLAISHSYSQALKTFQVHMIPERRPAPKQDRKVLEPTRRPGQEVHCLAPPATTITPMRSSGATVDSPTARLNILRYYETYPQQKCVMSSNVKSAPRSAALHFTS